MARDTDRTPFKWFAWVSNRSSNRDMVYAGLLVLVWALARGWPVHLTELTALVVVGFVVLYVELRRVVEASEQRLREATELLDAHLHTLEDDLERLEHLVRARP